MGTEIRTWVWDELADERWATVVPPELEFLNEPA